MSDKTSLLSRFDLAQIEHRFRTALPAVQLVALFGSRATGRATAKSDWDLGVLVEPGTYEGFEQLLLQDQVARILDLPNDRVDMVDLRYCSPLLGFAIATDGKPLYEANPIVFTRFVVKASKRYADTAKFRAMQRAYLGFPPSNADKTFFDITGWRIEDARAKNTSTQGNQDQESSAS